MAAGDDSIGHGCCLRLVPAAKGKVERPYRWLQDRIVRSCAIEKLTTIEEVRGVLKEEVNRYNNHQVHSTTGEVLSIRFDRARKEGNNLFLGLLPYPSRILRLRTSSTYERSERSTATGRYHYPTMR